MKRMQFNRLLSLQVIYAFLGIRCDVGSLLALRNTHSARAPADPARGVVGIPLFGLSLSTGLMRCLMSYRALMAVAIVVLGYGGVLAHLLNTWHLKLYQSV